MNRRTFINTMAVGILAAPLAAEGQPAGKTARTGYLSPVTGYNPVEDAFEQSLQELGWIKGRNIGIESRYSGGRQDTVTALAAELVGLRVDVIVAWGPTALAVKRATSQIPVVFLSMFADAVDLGLVSNLARPGGNVTGVGVSGLEMDAKRLQLLREAVPSLRRITLLVSSERTLSSERRRILTAAAKDLSLEIHETEVARPSELESAVRKEKNRGAQALYVAPSGFTFSFGRNIADLALANQLPSIHAFRESVMAGGLLSYAPSVIDVARRGAVYVDTAEALGLTWDRVDRSRGVILMEVTKSGRRREVPLNSEADTALVRRGPRDGGLVFGTTSWYAFRPYWQAAVVAAKITGFHFHDLRHTFASWAVQRGATLQEVKDLLGHSSLAMAMRYAHLSPEQLRNAVARLDGVLTASNSEVPATDLEPNLAASSAHSQPITYVRPLPIIWKWPI